jgi:hypothetical protein
MDMLSIKTNSKTPTDKNSDLPKFSAIPLFNLMVTKRGYP